MKFWWKQEANIPWQDEQFQRILDFYLFSCPCENKKSSGEYFKVSHRGKTFRQMGWEGKYLTKLMATMKHTASGYLAYQIYKSREDISLKTRLSEQASSLQDRHFEMICMTERNDMYKVSSVFYYIRNAFAHGSFGIVYVNGKRIYYLESAKEACVKAQMRLREETLLRWIDIVEASPNMLEKVTHPDKKARRKKSAA